MQIQTLRTSANELKLETGVLKQTDVLKLQDTDLCGVYFEITAKVLLASLNLFNCCSCHFIITEVTVGAARPGFYFDSPPRLIGKNI